MFATATPEAYAGVVFYLIAYVFMNLGAFAVIVALANRGKDADRIEDFRGLAQSRPGLAALMTIFMISLAGIPGTAGFIVTQIGSAFVGVFVIATTARAWVQLTDGAAAPAAADGGAMDDEPAGAGEGTGD